MNQLTALDNLEKQLENRQSQYNEAVRIWSEDMRMKKCSRVIN